MQGRPERPCLGDGGSDDRAAVDVRGQLQPRVGLAAPADGAEVGYLDAGPKTFCIEYDSSDPDLDGLLQQFRPGPSQAIGGSGTWKEASFVLPHARFAGRSNGADFRLKAAGGDLVVSHLSVRIHAE